MEQQNEIMSLIEAIRKRPAMYIGSVSVRGFNNLLHQIVQDIFETTQANYFSFELFEKLKGKFTFKNLQQTITDNVALEVSRKGNMLFTGNELAALNALSSSFDLKVFDKENKELFHQVFNKGQVKQGEVTNQKYEADSYEVTFDLDDTIFETYEPLNPNSFLEQIRNLAYLHKGKTLSVIYFVDGEISNSVFKFDDGMKDRIEVERLNGLCGTYFDTYFEQKFEDFTFEAAFCFREASVDEPFLKSFANYIYTHKNGTHVNAFLDGICDAVKKYITSQKLADVKVISKDALLETLVAAIHIKMIEPQFYGATKNKLSSQEIILPITEYVSRIMLKKMNDDEKASKSLLNCFRRFDYFKSS